MKNKFISGMLSAFRFGRAQVKDTKRRTELDDIMMVVASDLRNAYLKLTNTNERK